MPETITERDVRMFLRGVQHAIAIAQGRPKGVSILRAMKNEWTELSLRCDLGKGVTR